MVIKSSLKKEEADDLVRKLEAGMQFGCVSDTRDGRSWGVVYVSLCQNEDVREWPVPDACRCCALRPGLPKSHDGGYTMGLPVQKTYLTLMLLVQWVPRWRWSNGAQHAS